MTYFSRNNYIIFANAMNSTFERYINWIDPRLYSNCDPSSNNTLKGLLPQTKKVDINMVCDIKYLNELSKWDKTWYCHW